MDKKLKLVMIDDDPYFIHCVERFLEMIPGLRLKKATTDPREGLVYVLKKRVDILLLDIDMPQLNGFQLMSQIQHLINPGNRSARPLFVVLCSGYEIDPYDCFKHQAAYYIPKPLSLDKLIEVKNFIQRKITERSVIDDNHRGEGVMATKEGEELRKILSDEDTVTIKEAEGILGVKRTKIYNLRQEEKLTSLEKEGGEVRLIKAEVEALRDRYSVRKGKV